MKQDTFDLRLMQLKRLGFIGDRICLTNGKYAITYVQMDECDEEKWEEFINIISLTSTE